MTKIQERLRRHARAILNACLDAADPQAAVKRFLNVEGNLLKVIPSFSINLDLFDRVFVIGAGKASAVMARAVEDMLGGRVNGGLVSVKYGHSVSLRTIEAVEAGHPVPDRAGEAAGARMIHLLDALGERDLVISCISGGGSALLPSVPRGISPEEKQSLTGELLSVAASIHEINVVRKHLSVTKGGNLMQHAYPAFVVNFMLSDVVGDDPATIASGPFVPDSSTYKDALQILEKYGLTAKVPSAIIKHLTAGVRGDIPETPKAQDKIFERVTNVIVGSNFLSLTAGEAKARELGYRAMLLSSTIEGDTEQAAGFHGAVAREIRSSGRPLAAPACVLSGGETTVQLTGKGKGGRNQHFVLSLVGAAARIPDSLFLSAGTDGTDGPTDAAGALADSGTLARAQAAGLDLDRCLANHDSYNFFEPLGDLIVTGPTRTNVMDVRIILIG